MKYAKTNKKDKKKPYCIKLRPTMINSLNEASISTGTSKSLIIENGINEELKRINQNGIDEIKLEE